MELSGSDHESAVILDRNILSQLLMARGVEAEDVTRQAKPTLRDFLPDPSLFKDMDQAAQRIARAIREGERITIYGDYDVDGATSSAADDRAIAELLARRSRLLHSRSVA